MGILLMQGSLITTTYNVILIEAYFKGSPTISFQI